MTTLLTLHKGLDPRYLTAGAEGGHVGGTRYYTEAAGSLPAYGPGRARRRWAWPVRWTRK